MTVLPSATETFLEEAMNRRRVGIPLVGVLAFAGLIAWGFCQATPTTESNDFTVSGKVRNTQVAIGGTNAGIAIYTFVGIDTDDGTFAQLTIGGADMRFVQGLRVRVDVRTAGSEEIANTLYSPSKIRSVELIK